MGIGHTILDEAKKGPSYAVTVLGTKPMDLKFGKYHIIKDSTPTAVTTFANAVKNKYIGPGTQQNVDELLKVGYKFDTVYFIDRGGSPTTAIHGRDPLKKELFYIRKGSNAQVPPYFYYEREYGPVSKYYQELLKARPELTPAISNEEMLKSFSGSRSYKASVNPDGSYNIEGDVFVKNFIREGIRNIPLFNIPIKFNIIRGSFADSSEGALPLQNYPNVVYGSFHLTTKDTSLKSIPTELKHGKQEQYIDVDTGKYLDKPVLIDTSDIIIQHCPNLINLENFPRTEADVNIIITNCSSLVSLQGLPQTAGSSLQVSGCPRLRDLRGAPEKFINKGTKVGQVGGQVVHLYTLENLTSLEGLPAINGLLTINSCLRLESLRGIKPGLTSFNFANLSISSLEGMPREMALAYLKESLAHRSNQISKCNNLVNLVGAPQNLDNVTIHECESFTDFTGAPNLKNLTIHNCPNLTSLKGLPETMETLIITDCPNLKTLEGLPEKILNDLKLINCPGITEGVLLYYYVGSRVGGKIYFGNNPGWSLPSSLDKSQYTKEIRDALEKGSEEAGFDLDV